MKLSIYSKNQRYISEFYLEKDKIIYSNFYKWRNFIQILIEM